MTILAFAPRWAPLSVKQMAKRSLDVVQHGQKRGITSMERVSDAFEEIAESTDPVITLGGLIFMLDCAWKSMLTAQFLNMSYVDILRTTSSNVGDNVVAAVDDLLAEKMLRPQLFMDWSTDLDSLLALRFFSTQHVKFRQLIDTVCEDMVEYEMTNLAEELATVLYQLDELVSNGQMNLLASLFGHIVAKKDDNETMTARIARVKREELRLLDVLSKLPMLSCDFRLLRRIRTSL